MSDERKIIVRNCNECKWIVHHKMGKFGFNCHHPDINITKIESVFRISDFCPLDKN